MIKGVHAIVFSRAVDELRSFFRDAIDLPSVDAGGGWLIFALPPAELAVHPSDAPDHVELYLMCDDLKATLADLTNRGAGTAGPVSEQDWGRVSELVLPGGSRIAIYEPRHPTAHSAG